MRDVKAGFRKAKNPGYIIAGVLRKLRKPNGTRKKSICDSFAVLWKGL